MKWLNDKNELNTISLNAGTLESGQDLNSSFGIEIKICSTYLNNQTDQKSFYISHQNYQMSHQIIFLWFSIITFAFRSNLDYKMYFSWILNLIFNT